LDVEVTWRSGQIIRVSGLDGNRLYEIDEPAPDARPVETAAPKPSAQGARLFDDVTECWRDTLTATQL